jgi:hypothetical protein
MEKSNIISNNKERGEGEKISKNYYQQKNDSVAKKK